MFIFQSFRNIISIIAVIKLLQLLNIIEIVKRINFIFVCLFSLLIVKIKINIVLILKPKMLFEIHSAVLVLTRMIDG